jgi:hypothetical protein
MWNAVQSHVLLAWEGIHAVLAIPSTWSAMDLGFGLEDARILPLSAGFVLLLCTGRRPNTKLVRMVVVVVELPTEQPQDSRLHPVSITFLNAEDTGAPPRHEKNWMGYLHKKDLYLIRFVSPQETVSVPLQLLREAVGVQSVDAITELRLSAETDPLHSNEARGSTVLQDWVWKGQPVLLGVVHWRVESLLGLEFPMAFLLTEATPPFRILRISQRFKLKPSVGVFTFVVGLRVEEDSLVLDMGIDDCESASVALSQKRVIALLESASTSKAIFDVVDSGSLGGAHNLLCVKPNPTPRYKGDVLY